MAFTLIAALLLPGISYGVSVTPPPVTVSLAQDNTDCLNVLVIDTSKSMGGRTAVGEPSLLDGVMSDTQAALAGGAGCRYGAVVDFSQHAGVIVPFTDGTQDLIDGIGALEANLASGTAMGDALSQGIDIAVTGDALGLTSYVTFISDGLDQPDGTSEFSDALNKLDGGDAPDPSFETPDITIIPVEHGADSLIVTEAREDGSEVNRALLRPTLADGELSPMQELADRSESDLIDLTQLATTLADLKGQQQESLSATAQPEPVHTSEIIRIFGAAGWFLSLLGFWMFAIEDGVKVKKPKKSKPKRVIQDKARKDDPNQDRLIEQELVGV